MHIVDKIINKYQTNNSLYIGEKVTIAEHMIIATGRSKRHVTFKQLC